MIFKFSESTSIDLSSQKLKTIVLELGDIAEVLGLARHGEFTQSPERLTSVHRLVELYRCLDFPPLPPLPDQRWN